MQALCQLHKVPQENYSLRINDEEVHNIDFQREVDFYLKSGTSVHKCEIKLMGRGNPESADAVIARDSKVFIADKLSETNKKQLDSLNIQWVELRNNSRFQRFASVLEKLNIPHHPLKEYKEEMLNNIFKTIFS
jgi:hypothetical protein